MFDSADPNGVTAQRNETVVATQSLFLLNSSFVREQARAFAQRLLSENSLDDSQRIERAYRLSLSRVPSADEQADALAFLAAYLKAVSAQDRPEADRRLAAWQSYCQTLLCANEFLYVE